MSDRGKAAARLAVVVGGCLGGTAVAAAPAHRADMGLPLYEVARVELPGPRNRFDYQSIDPKAERLYISHMNADQLLVFDLKRRKVVKIIAAPGVHGVLAVPRLRRVFASATNAREVLTIDARTATVVAHAPAGDYPDGLAYDPLDRRVFVSDESGGVETVLDGTGHRITTIPLGGDAGNVQYDAGSGHLLVDVQSRNEVAIIDPTADKLLRRVSLPRYCQHDHGLLVDSPRRLAFVACDGNATLVTLDLRTMQPIGHAAVGDDPDVLALDPTLQRLYVSAESGIVAVFKETKHGLTKLGQSFLAPYAHTVAVDPTTHLVYFPLEQGSRGGPELLILRPTR